MNEQPILRETDPAQTEKAAALTVDTYILGFYNYSVIATLVGLCVSMIGICFSVFWPLPQVSVYCLLIAAAIDLMDGKIAKTRVMTKEEAGFGRTLDLLSDFSAFVLLPIAIGFACGMETAWFLPFLLIWLLAAVIRMSYLFATDAERRATGTRHRQVYLGLPTAAISLILPPFFLLRNVWPVAFPWMYGVLMVLVAVASLLRFRWPKFGFKGMLVYLFLGVAEMVLLALWG